MKPQITDNPVAAPSLPCIQCIPWFQQKPQTTQNTRKAQQTFSFSVAFSFCALCAFLWLISFQSAPICVICGFHLFISFPEFQMPFLGCIDTNFYYRFSSFVSSSVSHASPRLRASLSAVLLPLCLETNVNLLINSGLFKVSLFFCRSVPSPHSYFNQGDVRRIDAGDTCCLPQIFRAYFLQFLPCFEA